MKVYDTQSIRNIALIGHGGAGKTTLTEAMLYKTGVTSRLGKVEDGSTVSDFEGEEIKRKISIRTALVPIEWKENKFNLLDTPGYFDFVGEVKEALRVADSALIVISGSAGIEVGTEKAFEEATAAGLSKMFFITGMDMPNVEFKDIIEECKEKFGSSVAPIQIPWYEKNEFIGYIHVLQMVARRLQGDEVVTLPIPEEFMNEVKPIRSMILEAVAETDEILMEKYFAEEEITQEEIELVFKKGVMKGEIIPILCGSSMNGMGIEILMNTMGKLLPAPHEIVSRENGPIAEKEPNSLFIFKTMVDPFIGRFSLFKVETGQLVTDMSLINKRTGEVEKLSHLYVLQGKEQKEVSMLCAGDIGAVSKLKTATTNDTLGDKVCMNTYKIIDFPKPFVKMAIKPLGKGDEEKMSMSLAKLMAEDATIYAEYDKETHETVIYGIGTQQLDVIVNMLKNKFKVEVSLEQPRTPYRETIKEKANVRGKHKKQSGGHGQYGDVVMEFEASGDLETPYVFEEKVFGGSVPKQYFPAVEKGLEECILKGVLAGYPVVGLKATLLDGSYHPVDSSEMAFKMATTQAFKEGMIKAKPTLLEPIAHVEIIVPEEYTGDIMGDLKKRRGRMIGMDIKGRKQVIIAEVPLSELYTYAIDVRAITQGRGDVSYHFSRYEEAPEQIREKIIESAK